MRTITLKITDKQAEALAQWIAHLDVAPTDFEEGSPNDAMLVRRVGDKLAAERLALRKMDR